MTKRDVDRLKWDPEGKSQQVEYDDALPGFGVRVYASGKKSFIVRYRTTGGRSRLYTLGKYGVLTLQQARKKARKKLNEIDDGADPVAERKEARQTLTVTEAAEKYIERHAKPHRRSWKRDKRRFERYIVPALGHLALRDVKRADVTRLHADIGATRPVAANRVAELLRGMFNKLESWGHLPEGHRNPGANLKDIKYRERSRKRFVTAQEMPRLLKSIDQESNPYVRAALRMYLLTGLRKRELLALRWENVDLSGRELRIPDTKSGEPHTVPLSAPAVEILRDLPRMLHNSHVFCGRRRGKPLTDINRPWRKVRARAKLDDVTLHDLRRTVGSWLAMAGASLPLIGSVLNHTDPEATQVYARIAKDATRDALEDHARRIMAATEPAKENVS